MIVTSHLLSKIINISNIDMVALCNRLSDIGLEVESYKHLLVPSKVVVGKIIQKSPHPNADKLNVCQVDIGTEVLQIVCGAKNVAQDQYVALALQGAFLPDLKDGLEITKTNLRGIDSCGMICSSTELGLPKINEGIMILDESIGELKLGKELKEYSIFNNHIIEVSLTPNRGDCLSVLGIAREIACVYDLTINDYKEADSGVTLGVGRILQVLTEGKIQSSLLYKAVEIKQIQTPLTLQIVLAFNENLSQNPIKNFLEYSTYMTGVIINAYSVQNFDILNSKGVELSLTIKKDENGFESVFENNQKLSVIGVGNQINQDLEIFPKTIILEASYIDPVVISKLLHKNKIKEDKNITYRSTRGTNCQLETGMNCLCKLFLDFTKSMIYSGTQEVKQDYTDTIINTTFSAIMNIVGKNIEKEDITKILKNLNFRIKATCDENFFSIIPPSYRHDIKIQEDVAEEFLRIYGIDNILSISYSTPEKPIENPGYIQYKNQRDIATRALSQGFIETIHYLFYQKQKLLNLGYESLKQDLDLANPITSELDTLRTSLIPAMLDSVSRNKNLGYKSIKIFEIGSVYNQNREERTKLAFVVSGLKEMEKFPHSKGVEWDFWSFVETISCIIGRFELKPLDQNIIKSIHPYQSACIIIEEKNIGIISKINPILAKELDINDGFFCELDIELLNQKHIVAKEFSRFPSSQRDLTVLIDEKIDFSKILNKILEKNIKNLKDVYALDIYNDPNLSEKIALSIRLKISSMQTTLKEEDLNNVSNEVLRVLEDEFGVKLKD